MLLPSTRFADLSRAQAFWVLSAFALVLAGLLYATLGSAASPAPGASLTDGGDLQLYQLIVEELRSGRGYYDAAHQALLEGGYGTASVLNWRTPLYAWLLAAAPTLVFAQVVLGIAAAAVVLLIFRWVRHDSTELLAGLVALTLVASLAGLAAPGSVLFAEVAAGVLILLSIAAYGNRLPWLAIAAAAAALFIRELAGPYVVICAALALWQRRWLEVALWATVLVAYAVYFVLHMMSVETLLGPNDAAYADGWLQFGGLAFVLATAAFNGVLSLLPAPGTATVFAVALLGLVAWRDGGRPLATVLVYAGMFLAVGKPFNTYWGALYTPALTLGLAWGGVALLQLLGRLIGSGRPNA